MEPAGVKTPRRKRARVETAATAVTPPPSRSSPFSSTKDDGARVVWRDSPAEKQMRVSGTGKLAQQEEVQGFVGRIARASLQSPPTGTQNESQQQYSSHHQTDEDAAQQRRQQKQKQKKEERAAEQAKRKAFTRLVSVDGNGGIPANSMGETGNLLGEQVSVSRHILFSPESDTGSNKRELPRTVPPHAMQTASSSSSSRLRDSQDELLLLDQIDERLSREPDELAQVATPSFHNMHSTASTTQPLTASTAPASVQVASAAYVTPPRQVMAKQGANGQFHEKPLEFESPDFTDESWELLDQLEFQASQQIAHRKSSNNSSQSSQSDYFSQQVLPPAPPPRSLRTSGGGTSMTKSCDASSSAHQAYQVVAAATSEALLPPSPVVDKRLAFEGVILSGSADDDVKTGTQDDNTYKRLLVLEVDRDAYHRRVSLRLLDEDERHVEVDLVEDWYDTNVEAGDTIHLIFSERDRNGFFSQDMAAQAGVPGNIHTPQSSMQRVVVDNDHHLVIAHPDILVSPTSVTTSFGCLRRAVLKETLNVSRPTNQKALLGTLKHELFQHALENEQHDMGFMLTDAKQVVSSHVLQLIESSLSEETAMLELGKVMQDYQKWLIDARTGGVQLNEPSSSFAPTKVLVRQVLAVEEMLWSVKWGVKGAIDATVLSSFSSAPGEIVLPLELKTGSKAYGGVEHQGQVILYTLLLNERYQQQCQDGLLMYVPGIETNRIAAMASHIRGLVIARNKFAAAMARVKAMGSSTTSSHQQQALPQMLGRRRDCERCFQIDECVLHHTAVENGSADSSGLEDLFHRKVGHLEELDLIYFRKWNRLIDFEHQNADKHLRALWLQTGTKRERDPESLCIAQLRLVSDAPAPRGSTASASMRVLCLHRDQRAATDLAALSFLEHRFRIEDRVILSVESIDEKKLLVHIARGRIIGLNGDTIVLESFQSIPSVVQTGRSVVGAEYTWRIDKDVIASGLSRAKENLVKLFIGPAPEGVTEGTDPHLRSDLLANAVSQLAQSQQVADQRGDMRRRKLIVHLLKPRFRSSRFHDLLLQRQSKQQRVSASDSSLFGHAQQLHDDYMRLNIDQQRGVLKVLNSLDYALILGMPGTGKTSTIAFTVKVLIYLGFSVLITSYTHSAVDNLLLKLRGNDQFNMLRIGNAAQVHPDMAPYTLDKLVGDSMSVDAVEARFQQAKLVGCTCLGVNNHVLFSKRRFDFCIVDEATQTTEPVVLGPLRCADTFVLVGDHYQLPPLVTNAQARKEGMDVSLFRRLSEAHPEATQQLTYQYRMNRDIMLVANRLVYADKLKCGSHEVATNRLPLMDLPITAEAQHWPLHTLGNTDGVQFLNIDGVPSIGEMIGTVVPGQKDGHGGRGKKLENLVEARIVAGLVQILIAAGVKQEEIAVISPFRSQVALIQQQVRRVVGASGCQSVEVSTIDKYQGKDKDVILVSFVRCNAENHVGDLLTDWRRINVALTRAKQKLIMVGSKSTLRAGSALFHVLMELVDKKQWELALQPNAMSVLDGLVNQLRPHVAARLRTLPQPEPEGEPPVVHIHQRATSDIEGLVGLAAPMRGREAGRRHVGNQRPMTRDVMGEYKQR